MAESEGLIWVLVMRCRIPWMLGVFFSGYVSGINDMGLSDTI